MTCRVPGARRRSLALSRSDPCRGWNDPGTLMPWIVTAVLLCVAAIHYRHGQDIGIFWRTGQRFLAGGPLFPASDGFLGWRYAPGTALFFTPLALLPAWLAKAAWFAFLAAAGGLCVQLLGRLQPDWRPVALAFVALSRPMVEEYACGQVNLVVLLLALLAFRAEDEGRPIRAGLLLAVIVGLKLSPGLLLLDLLLRGRWKVLVSTLLGIALIAAAPVPFYGPAGTVAIHYSWIESLMAVSPVATVGGGNQSVLAFVARIGAPGWMAGLGAAVAVAVALWRPAPEPRRSLLLFATALTSPMGWIQNYVMALPALSGITGRGARYFSVATGLLLLVPMYDVSGPRFERWFFDHSLPFAAMAVLYALAASRTAIGDVGLGAPSCAQSSPGGPSRT